MKSMARIAVALLLTTGCSEGPSSDASGSGGAAGAGGSGGTGASSLGGASGAAGTAGSADGGAPEPEPVLSLATHGGGIYALQPKKNADGTVDFAWQSDNLGGQSDCRSYALLPNPDGSEDVFYMAFGGGFARKRASVPSGQPELEWVGPNQPGQTGWQMYVGIFGGLVATDPLHGDVACVSLGYNAPSPEAVGERGIYCAYRDTDFGTTERIAPPKDAQIGPIAVFPRANPADPASRTTLLVTLRSGGLGSGSAGVSRYFFDPASGAMQWQSLSDADPTSGQKALAIQPGEELMDVLVHRRQDPADRVTVFVTTVAFGCLWGSDFCPDGRVLYRDFTAAGAPVGQWQELAATADPAPDSMTYWGMASTSTWRTSDPPADQEAIFVRGISWAGGAYGGVRHTRLLRIIPVAGTDQYTVDADLQKQLGSDEQVLAVGVARDPADPTRSLVYTHLQHPAGAPGECAVGPRMDEVVRWSEDLGSTFPHLLAESRCSDGYIGNGSLMVERKLDPRAGETRGLHLCAAPIAELVKTPGSTLANRQRLQGIYGGHPFGLATSQGVQIRGNLQYRVGDQGTWSFPKFGVITHAVATGAERVYFGEWPYSHSDGQLVAGGGLYSLPAKTLGDAAMSDWQPVWRTGPAGDPSTDVVCSPKLASGERVPPVVSSLAVSQDERDLFAVLRTVGFPDDQGNPNDAWPSEQCKSGLWWAHRESGTGPFTWQLVLPEPKGEGSVFHALWLTTTTSGAQRVLLGLRADSGPRKSITAPLVALDREPSEPSGWKLAALPLPLPTSVDEASTTSGGIAIDALDSNRMVTAVAWGEESGGQSQAFSRVLVSTDRGQSFSVVPVAGSDVVSGEARSVALHGYTDGTHRLFVFLQQKGVLVQKDPKDLGSLELVSAGLGNLSSTTGPSTMAILSTAQP